MDPLIPKEPRTPLAIRLLGILIALAICAVVIQVVFTFAWYASGLAADREEARRRREAPIPVGFADPNAAP